MAEPAALIARGAFTDRLVRLPVDDAPILLAERTGLGIASILVRSGGRAALAERIGALSLVLPTGPTRSAAGDVGIVGTGPGSWLLLREGAEPHWASAMAHDLAGIASVADQSSGYAVLRIAGSGARDLISRGAFIDMHPAAFGPGSAAVTVIAHIGVILWQTDDAPTYEIALFRSYADSFWHWLETTAAGMAATLARTT